jgi:hypothetical protein
MLDRRAHFSTFRHIAARRGARLRNPTMHDLSIADACARSH